MTEEAMIYFKDTLKKIDDNAYLRGDQTQRDYIVTAISALEKQIPKEAIQLYKLENNAVYGSCPLCGASGMGKVHKCCWRCGQALKWSD